ncbi:MAG: glycosyltransferase family 4 protein [Bacillota bacterium]|jgi:glycosyltransferase involved in cell wall biosynthesis
MNVLHVVRPADGGMKNHILTLLRNLNKTKYRIFLACPHKNEWISYLKDSDIEVVEIPLKGELSPSSDLKSVLQLMDLIRKWDIDLVHTHGMKAGLVGRIAGSFVPGRAVPYLIATVHNSVYHYQMPRYQRHLLAKVQKYLAMKTDQFITVSKALKKEIMLWEGVPENKIQVIYNGIKVENFDKKVTPYGKIRLGLNPVFPVVGTVARLAPQKGLEYFIKAASLVSQVVDKVQFLIVGDGPLRKELEFITAKKRLQDKILFTGYFPNISEIYPVIDVFVMPSLSEGLSISIIEAMAAKRPIAATAVGGIPELIRHRESGLLVPPGNEQALAQAILELLKRPKWSEKLGEKAGKKARNEYTVEKMVQQTENIYRQFNQEEETKNAEKKYAHA